MGDTKIAKDGITYIAHRGNTEGPSEMENHPNHIAKALDQGFDVEVDVRIIDGEMFLGHDKPQYEVSQKILMSSHIWFHCKNIEALQYMTDNFGSNRLNYFWHDTDDYVLTNKEYIWTSPGYNLTNRSIMVMPELTHEDWLAYTTKANCYGICSDYVRYIKEERK